MHSLLRDPIGERGNFQSQALHVVLAVYNSKILRFESFLFDPCNIITH